MTRAELIAALQARGGAAPLEHDPETDPRTIHELRVRQEELDAQHEQLIEMQRALELSRDLYQELFDFSPLPYFVLDDNGVVRRLNLAAAALLEAPRSRVEGMPLLGRVHADSRRAFLDHMRRCRHAECTTTTTTTTTELVLVSRSGGAIPVELTCRASIASSAIRGMYHTVATDLRERKRAERDRLLAAAERERILAVQRAAREASDAKDRFLAVLSHELRTPLTPVMLATSAWKDDPSLSEPLRKTLAMISRNVGVQAHLIDDLLDMTRITQGKIVLHQEALDLHTVIEDVYDQARSEMAAASLVGSLALHAVQCEVSADPLRLRQIVWNLLKNAIRYTPAGGKITIATADALHGKVQLSITDTGAGFTADTAAKLFEPFQQGPRSTLQGGLGLGLAITKGLVEAHGGEVFASSDGPQRGSCFVVELPATAVPLSNVTPVEAPPVDGVAAHGGLRILLVEDHEDTAQALAFVLEHEGYTVALAHSVAQAIAASETRDIDVVVSDLGLPDGSGLDLMRHLRGTRKRMHGIALTGYGRREDLDETTRAGFEKHLTKPVDVPTLIAAIESLRPPPA
jgi:PAS domain S-box-containing protein